MALSFIAVNTPSDVCKKEKEAFYDKFTSVVGKCPRGDIRIVLGDFSAVSGCDRTGYEMSVGPIAWELISVAITAFFSGSLLGPRD